MFANGRLVPRVLLAASLGAGITATAAGCGSSAPAVAPASSAAPSPSSAAPSPKPHHSGSSGGAKLTSLAGCLRSHGVTLPSGATATEVKGAYRALSPAQQLSDFNACGNLMSAKLRQKIQALIGAATPTATS